MVLQVQRLFKSDQKLAAPLFAAPEDQGDAFGDLLLLEPEDGLEIVPAFLLAEVNEGGGGGQAGLLVLAVKDAAGPDLGPDLLVERPEGALVGRVDRGEGRDLAPQLEVQLAGARGLELAQQVGQKPPFLEQSLLEIVQPAGPEPVLDEQGLGEGLVPALAQGVRESAVEAGLKQQVLEGQAVPVTLPGQPQVLRGEYIFRDGGGRRVREKRQGRAALAS